MTARAAPFIVLERFHLAIAIVTVVASSMFLLALMLMLVDERRETVGILRLIGFRRRRILLHVLAEGVVIAVAGALFGIVLCAAFQGAINRFFQWRYDTALVFVRITPLIALRSVMLSVPLGVLAVVAVVLDAPPSGNARVDEGACVRGPMPLPPARSGGARHSRHGRGRRAAVRHAAALARARGVVPRSARQRRIRCPRDVDRRHACSADRGCRTPRRLPASLPPCRKWPRSPRF